MLTQAERFERCVKNVKKNFKPANAKNKKGIAIAICTKSILWPQKRTLRKYSARNGKPKLITQRRKF
jgi:hypothetical protein